MQDLNRSHDNFCYLAVVGSRGFDNYELLSFVIDEYCMIFDVVVIISGGAKGADTLAELYAEENKLPKRIHGADWKRHGKSAGFIRNERIVRECTEVVAFWDGKSKGTLDTINKAKKAGKRVIVIEYEQFKGFSDDWDHGR